MLNTFVKKNSNKKEMQMTMLNLPHAQSLNTKKQPSEVNYSQNEFLPDDFVQKDKKT
jgi:hypothetical protein